MSLFTPIPQGNREKRVSEQTLQLVIACNFLNGFDLILILILLGEVSHPLNRLAIK